MKPTLRDYLSILMAFAAVFLCGYGVGHLFGERQAADRPAPAGPGPEAGWITSTLPTLEKSLRLRPEQVPVVERELEKTAGEISKSRTGVLLEYHRHVANLYDRLIEVLDEDQARKLREEKNSLEKQIELLSPERPSSP